MMPFEVDGICKHFWTIIFAVVLVAVSVGLDDVFSLFFAKKIDSIIDSIVENFVQIFFVK